MHVRSHLTPPLQRRKPLLAHLLRVIFKNLSPASYLFRKPAPFFPWRASELGYTHSFLSTSLWSRVLRASSFPTPLPLTLSHSTGGCVGEDNCWFNYSDILHDALTMFNYSIVLDVFHLGKLMKTQDDHPGVVYG